MALPGKGRKRRKRRVVEAKAGARARKARSRVGKAGSTAVSRPGKAPRKAKAPGKLSGREPGELRGNTLGNAPGKVPGKVPGKISGKISGKTQGKTPGKVSGKAEGKTPALVPQGKARRPELRLDQGANPAAGGVDRAGATDPTRGRVSRKVDARGVSVVPGVLRSEREISVSASTERQQVGLASIVAGRVGAVLDPEGSSLPVPIASFLI
jgi:hypothetical protein